jgi:condensin-2 complex subunit D3
MGASSVAEEEATKDVKEDILALLEHTSSAGAVHILLDGSNQTVLLCEELLKSIQSYKVTSSDAPLADVEPNFIRTSIAAYNNKAASNVSVRELLGNLPSATTSKLPPLFTNLMSDRVDLASLLPATQDDQANEEAMGKIAITLTKKGFLAAELYAELIGMPGAWGAGLIDVGTLSGLSALLRRWSVECCGNLETQDEMFDSGGTKRKSSKASSEPNSKRSRKTSSRRTVVVDSDDDSLDEEILEEKESTYSFIIDEEDDDSSPILSGRDLMMGGLKVAQALGKASLGSEFVVWSCEAREAFVDSIITSLLAAAALTPSVTNSNQSRDPALNSLRSSVVSSLSTSLQNCLVLSPVGATLDDMVAELDSEYERAERNHDTAVAILRGLFPSLVLQIELPNGQKGKEAARSVAISSLEEIINVVAKSYERISMALTPSTTPKSASRQHFTPGSNAVPKNAATPATGRSSRKKRVSFGGLGDLSTQQAAPPTLKQSSTPMRSRAPLSSGLIPIHRSDRPRPILSAILGLLQKLATFKGLDRANVRSHVVDTLCKALPCLPDVERTCFLRFLIHLSHSKVSVHRLMCIELVSKILTEPWLWRDHSSQSMSPVTSKSPTSITPSTRASFSPIVECNTENMPLALFRILQGRLLDRSPGVRARTASCCSEMLQKVSREDISDLEADAQSLSSFASSIAKMADGFARKLRKRAAVDEGATVRKAAINALVELITFNESTQSICSESDIYMLSILCTDTAVSVRKASADALTTLLWHFSETNNCDIKHVLEEVWPASVLPMVGDAEPTCVAKAVDLFFRTAIEPLMDVNHETDLSRESSLPTPYVCAWMLLSRVSESSSGDGAARGEIGALRILVGKLSDIYGDEVMQNMLLAARAAAIRTLEDDSDGNPAFASDDQLEARLKGVWCLLETMADQEKELSGLAKLNRRRSFNLNFLLSSWETLLGYFQSERGESSTIQSDMKACLKVISKWAQYVQLEDAQRLSDGFKHLIRTFDLPTSLLGSTIAALIALTERIAGDQTKQECSAWIIEFNESCEERIASFVSSPTTLPGEDIKLVRALFVAGELSVIGFRADEDAFSPTDVTQKRQAGVSHDPVAGLHQPPSDRLLSVIQALLAKNLPKSDQNQDNPVATPESARAHAFLALGKLCLRNETLAKKCLTILARELRQSEADLCPSVQSNALLVLGDLCVRYTNLVDMYLPVMAACLQAGMTEQVQASIFDTSGDRTSLVRKHAVLLLSGLLLQDYIKWRGLFFQRFLVASADKNEGVARLAEMTLCGPLLTKYPKLFFNNFVESLFVLNRCTAHPVYTAAASAGDNGGGITVGFDGINLTGEAGKAERIHMYGMMLSKMSDEEKIGITARLANEVLGAALKSDGDLSRVCNKPRSSSDASASDENAYNVLSDAFDILTSPELQVGRASTRDGGEGVEDAGVESKAQHVAVAKDKLLSKISRKQLVEMVLPILCNLKATLQESYSPLLKDLMQYMVVIFRAYKVEVKEFLVNDPTLLQEVEYDARQRKKSQKIGATPTGVVVVIS